MFLAVQFYKTTNLKNGATTPPLPQHSPTQGYKNSAKSLSLFDAMNRAMEVATEITLNTLKLSAGGKHTDTLTQSCRGGMRKNFIRKVLVKVSTEPLRAALVQVCLHTPYGSLEEADTLTH